MKIFTTLLLASLLTACAGPFHFGGENLGKGYAVLSLSVSEECIDTGRFDNTYTGLKGVNGERGRPLNLRNMFAFPDFEEDGALFYSFPLDQGQYVIDDIGGMTKLSLDMAKTEFGSRAQVIPYNVRIEAGKVNYLGNLHLVGVDSNCESQVKFISRDRRERDLKKAAESQPHLFAAQ